MGDQHLSELCRGSEVEPIQLRLKQLAGGDVITEEDAAAQSSAGIWGYRDADGRTAFHWAVAMKNFTLATKLMSPPYDSPVLTQDSDQVTPFQTACSVGAPEAFVSDLLERSIAAYGTMKGGLAPAAPTKAEGAGEGDAAPPADNQAEAGPPQAEGAVPSVDASTTAAAAVLNHADALGNTALIHVVSRGYRPLARLLLEKGADINHQNARGQSVLHRAVSRGDTELVEELVRCSERANGGAAKASHRRWMDLQDFRGDSALFYASMENNEEVGRFLLHHGANRELRNKEGKQFWEV